MKMAILVNASNVSSSDSDLDKMMISSNCCTPPFACSLDSKQMPLTALHLSRMKLKCRQCLARRKELGDMVKNTMTFDFSSVEKLTKSHLAKLVTSANVVFIMEAHNISS